MLARATAKFLHQIDPEGNLIPLRRLNDSNKLALLQLVRKRHPRWPWQRPKYRPYDITLNHLLLGDALCPGEKEMDFGKYEGSFGDTMSGRLQADVGQRGIRVAGKGSLNLQFSFGKLKKQEVVTQKLLQASRGRKLNQEHELLRQVQGPGQGSGWGWGRGRGFRLTLAVLKERIITTQPCVITQQTRSHSSCSAMMGLIAPYNLQVSVQEKGSLERDDSISMEIPPGTVIAYSVMELRISHDGNYELSLQPDSEGSFEVDGLVIGSGEGPEQPIRILQQDLCALKTHLQLLAALPVLTRSGLFQLLRQVMCDRPTLSTLENAVEDLLEEGPSSVREMEDLSPCQQQRVSALLDLLQEAPPPHDDLITTVHLLLSAVEEMSDVGLAHLYTCCSPPVLKSLQDLVNGGMVNGESALADEEVCQRVEQLFSSSNMVLRREMGKLWAEPGTQPGLRPIVMCIAVQGLAALCTGL